MLKPFSAPLKVELANDGKSLTLLEPLSFIEYAGIAKKLLIESRAKQELIDAINGDIDDSH